MESETELDRLDREWRAESVRYFVMDPRGLREPGPAQHLIVHFALLGFFAVVMMGGISIAPGIATKNRLLMLGALLLILGAVLCYTIYQYRNSLGYERARAAYLRKRAAIKSKSEIPEGAFSESATINVADKWPPFSATRPFHFARDRVFRIRTEGENLYFARIAGQMDAHSVSMRMVDAVDQASFAELVGGTADDMIIPLYDVKASTIDFPGLLNFGHGKIVAVWRVRLKSNATLKFYINDEMELKRAIQTLSEILAGQLRLKLRWDETRHVFVKS
ncbi:MAG: hypothetical protein HY289_06490 [Planctomycetes bacterium]|nr:hypothetical protein [Planctomycetota bacterium]